MNMEPLPTSKRVLSAMPLRGSQGIDLLYKRFHSMLAHIKDVIVVYDRFGRYTYVNQIGIDLLGVDEEYFLGKHPRDLIPFQDGKSDVFEANLARVRRDRIPILQDVSMSTRFGLKHFQYILSVISAEGGEIEGFFTTSRDVTERKIMETKLRNQFEEIKSEREKRELFVTTLTHDLRTPLTSAKLGLQYLTSKPHEPSAQEAIVKRVLLSFERMEQMILDLLDANKIKAGEGIFIRKQQACLLDLANAIVSDLSIIHGDRITLWSDGGSMTGNFDTKNLRRVVENLVLNAVKYGDAKKSVNIKLMQTSEEVTISVQNSGNPIAIEDQKSLFEMYRRSESSSHGIHEGWGIGLTLVKGITEAHGGAVFVESNSEHGTTFSVKIPR